MIRWISIFCAIWLIGCGGITVRIDPLPVKKHIAKHRSVRHSPIPRKSPTPTPTVIPVSHPLQLEPTEKPTPMIKISNTAWGLSVDPMI